MKKERKEKDFIFKPTYPGGSRALGAFIKEHLQYPEDAFEAKIEGTVQLKITINYKGVVTDTKVLSSLGYGCNEEAARVARLLKFLVPKNRKVRAQFHKKINFHFRLPKQRPKPAPKTSSVQYTISKKKEEQPSPKPQPGSSYEYTIKW